MSLDHPAVYCTLNVVSGALLLAVATWCSYGFFSAKSAAEPAPLAVTSEVRASVRD